ncbi:MAG TPA: serine--tRNA ligase [Patescibacteria group bacterium]|nr:serine--tRNA ligase [Patescibacteria group bacterium]
MLDIKFIRDNLETVKKATTDKGYEVDFEKLLKIDDERKRLLVETEESRAQKNQLKKEDAEKGREIKETLKKLDPKLAEIEKEFMELMYKVPNPALKDVKVGKDEKDNEIIKKEGKIELKKGRDHLEIGKALDLIDVEAGAKASGSRFAYLKNQAAQLELALINFAMEILVKEGFAPIIPPQMLKTPVARATGYYESGEDDSFHLKDEDLVMIGTSEHSILAYHKETIFREKDLPKRYAGFSTCFRREAGSYGKDVKGILRVHQFDKVEMVSFVKPEESEKELQYLLSLEKEIVQALKLPYQVVKMCTGDLGRPAATKYDLETWMPGQEKYRETHSVSNCTDFQARRLNIKYATAEGVKKYPHILNGTAVAIGRMIIAILENYQQKDGTVLVPAVLQKYCGFKKIEKPKS